MTTKERFTVNIDADHLERFQRMAERHDVSLAWLGRQAIVQFLANHEGPQSELPFPPIHAPPLEQGRSA